MDISTITDKGQVTIPAALRKELGLEKGDKLMFTRTNNNEITIEKITNFDRSWHDFASKSFEEWDSPEDSVYDSLYNTASEHSMGLHDNDQEPIKP
ncbi:MAG: AbrB/MazE/SpoVT family DNA-binding domain-containing protein [Bdellovibrionales bacterium]